MGIIEKFYSEKKEGQYNKVELPYKFDSFFEHMKPETDRVEEPKVDEEKEKFLSDLSSSVESYIIDRLNFLSFAIDDVASEYVENHKKEYPASLTQTEIDNQVLELYEKHVKRGGR